MSEQAPANPLAENVAPKEEPKESVVPRDTYEKLLTEKKNYAERARTIDEEKKQLLAKIEEMETSKLKEKEDYKTMYEMSKKKSDELDAKLREREEYETKAIKMTQIKREWEKMGLRDAVSAEQLLKVANLDAVKYDPELKVVLGAEEEARRISENFKPMFGAASPRANHDAPQGAPHEMTVDAYNKLVASPEWRKMSRQDQYAQTAKLYEKFGVAYKK